MNAHFTSKTVDDLDIIAEKLLLAFPNNRCFAFYGTMGVGKTTFIKTICKKLDVVDVVNSPTFQIINEYQTTNKKPVYHFDMYRINNSKELTNLGCEEYFFSGAYCFIEWPEIVEGILPDDFVKVSMALAGINRTIRF